VGIRLIQIFEDEWLFKNAQVKGYIQSILNKWDHKIYARECEVDLTKNLTNFMEENHIQGHSGFEGISLIYNGEIVAGISLRRSSQSRMGSPEEGVWELTRYCVKIGYSITGGFKRLLHYFVKKHNPKQIITYSDERWTDGGMYDRNGFKITSEIVPNYTYFKKGTKGPRFNKGSFKKELIGRKFNIEIGEDDKEFTLMKDLCFDWIYDAGKKRWVLDFPPAT